jgi:hypothetical protein
VAKEVAHASDVEKLMKCVRFGVDDFDPYPEMEMGVDVNPWHLAMISIAQLQVLSLSTGTSEGFESFSISWTSHLHASGRSTNTLW